MFATSGRTVFHEHILFYFVATEARLSEKTANKEADSNQRDSLMKPAHLDTDPEVQIEEDAGTNDLLLT